MDIKSAVPAIGFALLLSTGLAAADDKTIVAKSGETVDVRPVYGALRCRSILVAPPEIEVLQAPPELKLSIREDMVTPLKCQDKVKGGFVVATVGEVKEPTEGKVSFRVIYKTKDGKRQSGYVYKVSLFPK
jgi:GAF domain-containing protein